MTSTANRSGTLTLRTPLYWIQIAILSALAPGFLGVSLISLSGALAGRAVGAVVLAGGVLIGVRFALTELVVDGSGIARKGMLRSRRWRWDEVKDFEIARDPWLGLTAWILVRSRDE